MQSGAIGPTTAIKIATNETHPVPLKKKDGFLAADSATNEASQGFPRLITDLPDDIMELIYEKLKARSKAEGTVGIAPFSLWRTCASLRKRDIVLLHALQVLIKQLDECQKLTRGEKNEVFEMYTARIARAPWEIRLKAIIKISTWINLEFSSAIHTFSKDFTLHSEPASDVYIAPLKTASMMIVRNLPIHQRSPHLIKQLSLLENYAPPSKPHDLSEHIDAHTDLTEKTKLLKLAIDLSMFVPGCDRTYVLSKCAELLGNLSTSEFPVVFKYFLAQLQQSFLNDANVDEFTNLHVNSIQLLGKYFSSVTDTTPQNTYDIVKIFRRYLQIQEMVPYRDLAKAYKSVIEQVALIKDLSTRYMALLEAGKLITKIADDSMKGKFLQMLFVPLEAHTEPQDYNIRYFLADFAEDLPAKMRIQEERKLLKYLPILSTDGRRKTSETLMDLLGELTPREMHLGFRNAIMNWQHQQKEISNRETAEILPT